MTAGTAITEGMLGRLSLRNATILQLQGSLCVEMSLLTDLYCDIEFSSTKGMLGRLSVHYIMRQFCNCKAHTLTDST